MDSGKIVVWRTKPREMARGGDRCLSCPGQAVAEFALVSLILLTLIFGMIDLGRAVFDKAMLSNATREAVRYGVVNSAQAAGAANLTTFQSGIVAAAAARSPSLDLTAANFHTSGLACAPNGSTSFTTAQCTSATLGPGDRLRVCSTYTFRFAAAQLIPIGAIVMNECSQVIFQ